MDVRKVYRMIAIIVITGVLFISCSSTKRSSMKQLLPEVVNEIIMSDYLDPNGYRKTIQITNAKQINSIMEKLNTASWELIPGWNNRWAHEFEITVVGDDSKTFVGLGSIEGYAKVTVIGKTSEPEYFQIPDTIFKEMYGFFVDFEEQRPVSLHSEKLKAARNRIIETVKSINKDEAIVTVNGVPINHRLVLLSTKFREISHEVFLIDYENGKYEGGNFEQFVRDIFKEQEDGVLNSLLQGFIRRELLYQEAVRRGLGVTEEEAQDYTKQNREGLYAADSIDEVLEQYAITLASFEMSEEEYWDWAVSLYQRGMSIGKLSNELGEEGTELLYQQLLESADVQYLIDNN
jgi:hypothetical protein